ncbi:RrF2 family transcriptional regulator [Neotabrizicola shimadae]|uniref:Rrf2 family transcriptional regulator n=1 Tax=Neotabrizicola shimadae TaxID=2807096 RepID=A0A8G1EBI8_9RHOB|nr:Rrf2 family transcriptional regulator [Neotabrizicola shimadae]QYZ69447.1 Rrf2 family transcriptional regulator [Neotabrizicola shimadae]
MRLTKFSDYAIRVLLFAANRRGERCTIEEAARAYSISEAHLRKVVRELSHAGFLVGTKGRTGGFSLARDPAEIRIGDILRVTESDFALFECQCTTGDPCLLRGPCSLPAAAAKAVRAFLAVFDEMTLVDVLREPNPLGPPHLAWPPALPAVAQANPGPT